MEFTEKLQIMQKHGGCEIRS